MVLFQGYSKKVIGLSGVAGSGKDLFCKILIDKLNKTGISACRFALADALKEEVKDWCIKHYGINPVDCRREDKGIIRPFLVFHGNLKRTNSHGKHWVNILENEILKSPCKICIVTDIRYAQYEFDEVDWIKTKLNGKLVHIQLLREDGSVLEAPNPEEKFNDPILQQRADFRVRWPHSSTVSEEELHSHVEKVIKDLSDIINELRNT